MGNRDVSLAAAPAARRPVHAGEEPPRERWREAKRPRSRWAGPYGHPLHPLLVPVPIGAWLASLVFDVASCVGGPPRALAIGSSWLIALGIVGALVAAGIGFLDLLQVPAGTRALLVGVVHMVLNVTSIALYAGGLVLRWHAGASAGGVPAGLIVLSAIAFSLLAVAGFLGGKLSYRYGVRVADERAQREAYAEPELMRGA